MSVHYYVTEKFEIKETNRDTETANFISILFEHFRVLCGDALLPGSETTVNYFSVTADGKTLKYGEATYGEIIHTILESRENLSIKIDYSYTWRGGELYKFIGFGHWMDFVIEQNDAFLANVYCGIYNQADCAEGCGIFAAYGTKDGKLYRSEVPFTLVDTAPEGIWVTDQTAVILDDEEIIGGHEQELIPLCERLSKLSSYDDFEIGEEFCYFMNNAALKSPADIQEYIDCVEKISKLLGLDYFRGETEFVDGNGYDRMLRILTDGAKATGFEVATI